MHRRRPGPPGSCQPCGPGSPRRGTAPARGSRAAWRGRASGTTRGEPGSAVVRPPRPESTWRPPVARRQWSGRPARRRKPGPDSAGGWLPPPTTTGRQRRSTPPTRRSRGRRPVRPGALPRGRPDQGRPPAPERTPRWSPEGTPMASRRWWGGCRRTPSVHRVDAGAVPAPTWASRAPSRPCGRGKSAPWPPGGRRGSPSRFPPPSPSAPGSPVPCRPPWRSA